MPSAVLLVYTNPVDPVREDAFNDWYTNVHVPEVLQVEGIVGATRYRLSDIQLAGTEAPTGAAAQHRYLAIYQLTSDDLADTIAALRDAAAGDMTISDALDREHLRPSALLFEEIPDSSE